MWRVLGLIAKEINQERDDKARSDGGNKGHDRGRGKTDQPQGEPMIAADLTTEVKGDIVELVEHP